MLNQGIYVRRGLRAALALAACGALVAVGCSRQDPHAAAESAPALVHLDDLLDEARIESAAVPPEAKAPRAWSFAEPQPEWRAISSDTFAGLAGVELEQLEDGVRVALVEPKEPRHGPLVGGLAVDLPAGPLRAWANLRVRARSHARLAGIGAACNVETRDALPHPFAFFAAEEGTSPVYNDGSVQDYLLPLVMHEHGDAPQGEPTLRSVALLTSAPQPAALEILSVELVPRGAAFLQDVGARSVTRDAITRRTLFAHAPARLAFPVNVPGGGRLDFALACLPGEPMEYRTLVQAGGGEPQALATETIDDSERWHQRSLDLSRWSGQRIELVLEAQGANPGAVALWGAPIVSGSARAERPNVIFYVIDGGGADLMSVYGYNRRTTPYLERLAQEGVVFERAHSNSTWTQPSTASFMTSLHHSVLGGLRRGVHSTPVPPGAVTMAEGMRAGGYATAVLTTNPNAARVIGLDRGVDFMRDVDAEDHSASSAELHEWFWRFRDAYPGHPYWVHFQTTDVHEPNHSKAPFQGLFVPAEEARKLDEWDELLDEKGGHLFGTMSIAEFYDAALAAAGVERSAYFNVRRGLYDETMAHQDRELGRLVERLKAEGEWENTLLVIAADHGHPAGTFARFGRGLIDPPPESWQGALFDSYSTRVPLMFFWPGHIEGGRRIDQPVSMIDVLPTILDLAGLPPPEVLQGRSLAPLLLGRELEPAPVILDEFRVDEATGEMVGNIEMIDGRWGASLEIGPLKTGAAQGRHSIPAGGRWGAVHKFYDGVPRLLLYDLWNDPFAARAVNDEHPELVERYRKLLIERWEAHRLLAEHLGEAADHALDPEVLKELQALGYTR